MKINTFSFSPWVAPQWYSWIAEEIISWFFFPLVSSLLTMIEHMIIQPDAHWSMLCQNNSFHHLSPCCEGHKNELLLQCNSFILQPLDAVSNKGDSDKENYYSLLDILIDRSLQNICLMTIRMIKFYSIIRYNMCISNWFKKNIHLANTWKYVLITMFYGY